MPGQPVSSELCELGNLFGPQLLLLKNLGLTPQGFQTESIQWW